MDRSDNPYEQRQSALEEAWRLADLASALVHSRPEESLAAGTAAQAWATLADAVTPWSSRQG